MTVRAVHHLNCGTMCPVLPFLTGDDGKMVSHCLLVETDRDGLVLVDTGFGTRDLAGATDFPRAFRAIVRPTFDTAETALSQVRALGFEADDVRHIVVTHLDLDHAGGIPDFPHASVHLHARELQGAANPKGVERGRYIRKQWAHGPKWETYVEDGDTWRGLPAVTKLRGLDADIGLLPMHGHSRGHSAVIVNAGARWKVHAGDAYFHRRSVDGAGARTPIGLAAFETFAQFHRATRVASAAALAALRARHDDLDMFCAHDPVELRALVAAAVPRPQRTATG